MSSPAPANPGPTHPQDRDASSTEQAASLSFADGTAEYPDGPDGPWPRLRLEDGHTDASSEKQRNSSAAPSPAAAQNRSSDSTPSDAQRPADLPPRPKTVSLEPEEIARAISRPPVQARGFATPLSERHYEELAQANRAGSTWRRVSTLARFNAWGLVICSALTLTFAVPPMVVAFITGAPDAWSPTALIVGLVLGFVAWNEFAGDKMLRHFNPRAVTRLGWNQLLFGLALLGYAIWQIYGAITHPISTTDYSQYGQLPDSVKDITGSIDTIMQIGVIALYVGMGLIAIFHPGGCALYYFTRRSVLERSSRQTPPWIRDLRRRGWLR